MQLKSLVHKFQRGKKIKGSFVVGCSHSGTSLLIRMLGSHPQIHAVPGETKIFKKYEHDQQDLQWALKEFDAKAIQYGKSIWVEKTPLHIHYIDTINRLRPEAKILAITRDPRDVACSIKARGFSFEEGLDRWIVANSELTKHTKKENVFVLKLEELTNNPESLSKEVLSFLELPYHNLLDYHKSPEDWYSKEVVVDKPDSGEGDNHSKLRNWQINQPIIKNTHRYQEEATDEDKQVYTKLEPKLEPLLTSLGYRQ